LRKGRGCSAVSRPISSAEKSVLKNPVMFGWPASTCLQAMTDHGSGVQRSRRSCRCSVGRCARMNSIVSGERPKRFQHTSFVQRMRCMHLRSLHLWGAHGRSLVIGEGFARLCQRCNICAVVQCDVVSKHELVITCSHLYYSRRSWHWSCLSLHVRCNLAKQDLNSQAPPSNTLHKTLARTCQVQFQVVCAILDRGLHGT
jgi:hypothetical protein